MLSLSSALVPKPDIIYLSKLSELGLMLDLSLSMPLTGPFLIGLLVLSSLARLTILGDIGDAIKLSSLTFLPLSSSVFHVNVLLILLLKTMFLDGCDFFC